MSYDEELDAVDVRLRDAFQRITDTVTSLIDNDVAGAAFTAAMATIAKQEAAIKEMQQMIATLRLASPLDRIRKQLMLLQQIITARSQIVALYAQLMLKKRNMFSIAKQIEINNASSEKASDDIARLTKETAGYETVPADALPTLPPFAPTQSVDIASILLEAQSTRGGSSVAPVAPTDNIPSNADPVDPPKPADNASSRRGPRLLLAPRVIPSSSAATLGRTVPQQAPPATLYSIARRVPPPPGSFTSVVKTEVIVPPPTPTPTPPTSNPQRRRADGPQHRNTDDRREEKMSYWTAEVERLTNLVKSTTGSALLAERQQQLDIALAHVARYKDALTEAPRVVRLTQQDRLAENADETPTDTKRDDPKANLMQRRVQYIKSIQDEQVAVARLREAIASQPPDSLSSDHPLRTQLDKRLNALEKAKAALAQLQAVIEMGLKSTTSTHDNSASSSSAPTQHSATPESETRAQYDALVAVRARLTLSIQESRAAIAELQHNITSRVEGSDALQHVLTERVQLLERDTLELTRVSGLITEGRQNMQHQPPPPQPRRITPAEKTNPAEISDDMKLNHKTVESLIIKKNQTQEEIDKIIVDITQTHNAISSLGGSNQTQETQKLQAQLNQQEDLLRNAKSRLASIKSNIQTIERSTADLQQRALTTQLDDVLSLHTALRKVSTRIVDTETNIQLAKDRIASVPSTSPLVTQLTHTINELNTLLEADRREHADLTGQLNIVTQARVPSLTRPSSTAPPMPSSMSDPDRIKALEARIARNENLLMKEALPPKHAFALQQEVERDKKDLLRNKPVSLNTQPTQLPSVYADPSAHFNSLIKGAEKALLYARQNLAHANALSQQSIDRDKVIRSWMDQVEKATANLEQLHRDSQRVLSQATTTTASNRNSSSSSSSISSSTQPATTSATSFPSFSTPASRPPPPAPPSKPDGPRKFSKREMEEMYDEAIKITEADVLRLQNQIAALELLRMTGNHNKDVARLLPASQTRLDATRAKLERLHADRQSKLAELMGTHGQQGKAHTIVQLNHGMSQGMNHPPNAPAKRHFALATYVPIPEPVRELDSDELELKQLREAQHQRLERLLARQTAKIEQQKLAALESASALQAQEEEEEEETVRVKVARHDDDDDGFYDTPRPLTDDEKWKIERDKVQDMFTKAARKRDIRALDNVREIMGKAPLPNPKKSMTNEEKAAQYTRFIDHVDKNTVKVIEYEEIGVQVESNEETKESVLTRVPFCSVQHHSLETLRFESELVRNLLPGGNHGMIEFGDGTEHATHIGHTVAVHDISDVCNFRNLVHTIYSLQDICVQVLADMRAFEREQSDDPESLDLRRFATQPISTLVPIRDGVYGFNPANSVDVRDLVVRMNHCCPVYREIWPSIRGLTPSVVECAPDAREVVRSFYYRIMDARKTGYRVEGLFDQETVDWVNENMPFYGIPPWKNTASVAHVSLRIAFFLHMMPIGVKMTSPSCCVRIPGDDSTRTMPHDLYRLAAAIILGYGITRTDAQKYEIGEFPGWYSDATRTRMLENNRNMRDALDFDDENEFDEMYIPGCNAFKVDAFNYYYGSLPAITYVSPESYRDQLAIINTWTIACRLIDVELGSLIFAMRILHERCVSLGIIQISTPFITSVPMMLGAMCINSEISFEDCANVIMRPYTNASEYALSWRITLTKPAPMQYYQHGEYHAYDKYATGNGITGSRLKVNSLVVLDMDTQLTSGKMPRFLSKHSQHTICDMTNVVQFISADIVPKSVAPTWQRHLVTFYSGMLHFQDVFFPCELSEHKHTNPSTQSLFDIQLGMTMQDVSDDNDVFYTTMRDMHIRNMTAPTADGVTNCRECAFLLSEILPGVGRRNAMGLFPYCRSACIHRGSTHLHRRPIYCDARPEGRCMMCAGRYRASVPRVLIAVDFSDVTSMERLIKLVALLRSMRCDAHIIVHMPSIDFDDTQQVADATEVATKLITHLIDTDFFPRIRITVQTPGMPTEKTLFDVADDFLHISSNGAGKDPTWHKDITEEAGLIHALCLSVVLRIRDSPRAPQCIDITVFVLHVLNMTHYASVQPYTYARGVYLHAEVRAVLVYFDHIGLIKYCPTQDQVWVSLRAYLHHTQQNVGSVRREEILTFADYTQNQIDLESTPPHLVLSDYLQLDRCMVNSCNEAPDTLEVDRINARLLNLVRLSRSDDQPHPALIRPLDDYEAEAREKEARDERSAFRALQVKFAARPGYGAYNAEVTTLMSEDHRDPPVIEWAAIQASFQYARAQRWGQQVPHPATQGRQSVDWPPVAPSGRGVQRGRQDDDVSDKNNGSSQKRPPTNPDSNESR